MNVRGCVYLVMIVSILSVIYYLCELDGSSTTTTNPKPCGIACSVDESPHFLIHTPSCVIPDFDPLDPSLSQYRQKNDLEIACSAKRPLTETRGLFLVLHKEHAEDYGATQESLNCSYRGIRRIQQDPVKYNHKADKNSQLRANILLVTEESTPIHEDGIYVTCQDTDSKDTTVYKNVHYFLQPKRVKEKREKFMEDHEQRRPE
ncbi:uncharacterized protein LOC121853127 [Homarus americanus]|uniref:uncharacterized protein LOC121853127 n=1 Tax=Homarus americanus TaxID=6706 RepID=UPI001C46EFDB|nr:uncharacterized protein LOC121853127 [Homarus americanus]